MPSDANLTQKGNSLKNALNSNSGFISLISVVICVIYLTWIGYIRFLKIQISFYDFSSWQSIFYSDNVFVFFIPIMWGVFLWILLNYFTDLLSPTNTVGVWKTLALLVFANGFSKNNIKRWGLFGLGIVLPFLFFFLQNNFDLPPFNRPIFPYLSIFTLLVPMVLLVGKNYLLHTTRLCSISKKAIRQKCFFYDKCVPLIIPFFIVVAIIIVPDSLGKVWGMYKIYTSLYGDSQNSITVNITPEVCWPHVSGKEEVAFFQQLRDEVVYIRKYKNNSKEIKFLPFLFNYVKGTKINYSLCMVSLSQIKFDGSLDQDLSPMHK